MKAVTLLQDIYIKDQSHIYPLIRQKDYIQEPKSDGYRSIHIVFGYNSQIDIERM
jgi:ppGpp synthetase/RelA/SpoT-type nucleotidyltranferase